MGRVPRRRGWSYPPQRPWHAVHRHGVHHQGYGIWDAAVDRHRRRLVRQRHGRKRRRRVQDRAGMAAQTLRGSEGPGIGDVPVGLVAGTRSGSTSPWATGHPKRWKPSIMQTKRHKPPPQKGGTKIRPLHDVGWCGECPGIMYSDHYPETISGLILFDNLLSNSVRQNGINLTFLKSLFFVLF